MLGACNLADNSVGPVEPITDDQKSTDAEDRVHEFQTELSQSPLGTMQATETIESP